ncbi:MAG: hypothetical protein V4543_08365 [Bacteroidota bacterium]
MEPRTQSEGNLDANDKLSDPTLSQSEYVSTNLASHTARPGVVRVNERMLEIKGVTGFGSEDDEAGTTEADLVIEIRRFAERHGETFQETLQRLAAYSPRHHISNAPKVQAQSAADNGENKIALIRRMYGQTLGKWAGQGSLFIMALPNPFRTYAS